MYALEADSPTGQWTEKGQVHTGMDTFCLDATVFGVPQKGDI